MKRTSNLFKTLIAVFVAALIVPSAALAAGDPGEDLLLWLAELATSRMAKALYFLMLLGACFTSYYRITKWVPALLGVAVIVIVAFGGGTMIETFSSKA